MSRIELLNLNIKNVKGLRLNLVLDGNNAIVTGQNEVGKTRIKDAFHWLLFDKSSDGKPSSGKGSFGLRPHHINGNAIHDITVMAEAEMKFEKDGRVEVHKLRKEQIEKKIKGKITGYPNQYFIDDAPALKKDFDKFIDDYISEDVFKLLTDVFYFCGELHHLKRREFLIKLANPRQPTGYDGLLERASKHRNLDDYKKAKKTEKDGYEKEVKQIPPRIDEILRGLEQPENIKSMPALQQKRMDLSTESANLKYKRQELLSTEKERQGKINRINRATIEQNIRGGELRNDPSRTASLQVERTQLLDELGKAEGEVRKLAEKLNKNIESRTAAESDLRVKQTKLDAVRQEYHLANEKKESTVCYTCGQKLPEKILKEAEEKRKAKLAELKTEGDKLFDEVNEAKKQVADFTQVALEGQQIVDTAKAELEGLRVTAEARLEQIAKEIAELPEPDYAQDETWMKLDTEIKAIQAEVGEPVTEQLKAIENKLDELEADLNKVNETLAQADRMEKDRKRVQELEAREKELAQLIAGCDKEIDLIKQYNLAYSRLVEEAVSEKFRHTEFKLFEYQINGEIDDRVCEAIDSKDGTAWTDMSMGQSIFIGIDVINTLSESYDVSVPLFIDNAQDITHPIITDAQTIALKTVENVKELQVKIGGKAVA